MAFGLGLVGSNSGFGSTMAINLGTVTTGSTVLVGIAFATNGGNLFSSLADNFSSSYAQQGTAHTSVNPDEKRFYVAQNVTGGANFTITLTTTNSNWCSLIAIEIIDAEVSSIDQFKDAIFDNAAPYLSDITGTTTQATEMAISLADASDGTSSATVTWGGGYTSAVHRDASNVSWLDFGYLLLSSTGTQQATISTLSAGVGAYQWIITIKAKVTGAYVNTTLGQGKRVMIGNWVR